MQTSNLGLKKLGLFEGYGIELEYMIVGEEGVDVAPVADQILRGPEGKPQNDVTFDDISWSNELGLHLIELKTSGPRPAQLGLHVPFQNHVRKINSQLRPLGYQLLPTSMHPWMDPGKETRLWPHGNKIIYQTYDRLFNCQGHGWSNLQSVHLNLAFQTDEEFYGLHESIRLLLPLMPALVASSPVVEGKVGPCLSTRLWFYKDNQKKIASIIGDMIPESVLTQEEYHQRILQSIERDIRPYDPEGILEPEWLNSRAAIPKFERMAIEIRALDIQECPLADLACTYFISEVLKILTPHFREKFRGKKKSESLPTSLLKNLFFRVMRDAEEARIGDGEEEKQYLSFLSDSWGLAPTPSIVVKDLWWYFWEKIPRTPENTVYLDTVAFILKKGCLARRILNRLGVDHGQGKEAGREVKRPILRDVYLELMHCLQQGELFGK